MEKTDSAERLAPRFQLCRPLIGKGSLRELLASENSLATDGHRELQHTSGLPCSTAKRK